jgi:hypothetical protein
VVAAAVFAGALGVGYVVSSPGSAEPASEPVGSTAVPLDVPAVSDSEASLGKVEALPGLARKPPPPPPPEPEEEEDFESDEPVEPEPVDEFVPPAPVEPAPPPPPPPPPAPPPVDFDDSG